MGRHSQAQEKSWAIFTAALFLISSCSASRTVLDQYREADSDRKIAYLAYYADLTPEQRAQILDPESDSPRVLIETWKVHPQQSPNTSFDDFIKDVRHHKIRSLEVVSDKLTDGAQFKAIAHYADDRNIDVTDGVTWKTTPAQLKMDGNVLHFTCLNADAVVSATFLDEQEGSLSFAVKKPLDTLELRIAESELASDKGYIYQLELLAHCQDGTRSDVSCQADWSSSSKAADISGCGSFSISFRERTDRSQIDDVLKVTAKYGGLSQTRILPAPSR